MKREEEREREKEKERERERKREIERERDSEPQPPFGPSVGSHYHPSMHHNNSPLFETSATALCSTTGILDYNPCVN